MSRLELLKESELDAAQKRLHAALTGGERGKAPRKFPLADAEGRLSGPFNALLYAPEIGDAAQKLGGLLRFQSSLPGPLREVAILTVARRWQSNYEWFAHAIIAAREGVDEAAIDAIMAGDPPAENADWALVHRFVKELLETTRVTEATYAAVRDLLGERGLVELVTLAGYYCMISGVLNVFEVDMPPGERPPFGE